MPGTVVVVLAGGESRRFGSDKLAADLDGRSLIEATLDSIPSGLPVLVVGPGRRLRRRAVVVREDPPGGGPAAGLVAGLTAALADGADHVVTLPGDAPSAGVAVPVLSAALGAADVAVAVDDGGQVFPLQLACTAVGARTIIAAAGPTRGAGASVRRLLASLDPRPVPVRVVEQALRDVDTPADLVGWHSRPPAE